MSRLDRNTPTRTATRAPAPRARRAGVSSIALATVIGFGALAAGIGAFAQQTSTTLTGTFPPPAMVDVSATTGPTPALVVADNAFAVTPARKPGASVVESFFQRQKLELSQSGPPAVPKPRT